MSVCNQHVRSFKVVLGVAIAGLLAVPIPRLAFADDGSSAEPGFVLLSMEQAAMFRGAQAHTTCTGTREYTGCVGTDIDCSSHPQGNCAGSLGRLYTHNKPTYCTCDDPGPQGTCEFVETVDCYWWFECYWDPQSGCQPVWGSGNTSKIDKYKCTVPAPVPNPNPAGG